MFPRILLTLPVLLILALPLPAADKAAEPVVVPFEMLSSGHMAVKVKVDDKGPYKLIFDTGAPVVLLNNRIAREAKLLQGAAAPAFNLFGMMGETRVKKVELGGLKVEGVKAIIMDHPLVEAMSRQLGPIDGIVGFPFFARFRMTIDFQGRTLSFLPGRYEPGDVLQSVQATLLRRLTGSTGPRLVAPAAQWGLAASKKDEDDSPGITIREVFQGSPAARAGLRPGDRILTVDDRWTDSLDELYTNASTMQPGTDIPLRIERDGKEKVLTIHLVSGL